MRRSATERPHRKCRTGFAPRAAANLKQTIKIMSKKEKPAANGTVVHGMPNEQYHYGQKEREYLSSSQLKKYAISPKAARHAFDNPQEQSDAMRIGSLFHEAMQCFHLHGTLEAFRDSVAIYTPPVNPKTGQPYGAGTKAYAESYAGFLECNGGRHIMTSEEFNLVMNMAATLVVPNIGGDTAQTVLKFLKWGKPEVSHFLEYEGLKFKFRPDIETGMKIVDYKTVATDDLSERSLNGIIARYGYDISAAFYQFMEHEQSGVWKQFYWVFVSKVPPHDAVVVDASGWAFDYDPLDGIVTQKPGAVKMRRLLDLHIECTRNGVWPGSEIFLPRDANGNRIMTPQPPSWEVAEAARIIEQSFNQNQ